MRNLKLGLFGLFVFVTSPSLATMTGMNISATTLFLTSSTQQGGQGPTGSTVLIQGDAIYNWDWYAIGLFYTFDLQGNAQKDHGFGPKIEFSLDPFYIEGGYAILMRRDFTDRSIAVQKGNGWFIGLGIRFGLEAEDTGIFFQASYKIRLQNITEQDGVALSEPIRIQDGYPLVGLGINF